MKLTDLQIKRLALPEGATKQKTFFDEYFKGFGLRVSIGGSKTFVLMHGKRRKLRTLGRYPDMSLAEARIAAKKVQGQVVGKDDATPARAPTISYDEVRMQFLKDTSRRTKTSTHDEYTRSLYKHFNFSKPITSVTRNEIFKIISDLQARPSSAHHAFISIRTLMNWAVLHGYITTSPVPPLRFKPMTRSRTLTDEELVLVWQRAEAVGHPYGTIVKLLILTGQRRGEIAGLRRSWLTKDGVTFPAGFCKNKREHVIPLGPMARDLIESIPIDGDLVFPARGKPNTPFWGWSKSKVQFATPLGIAHFTLHDLRRTFSSQLAALGTPIHVTEKLLNHVSGTLSGVAAIYNRYSYAAEMRSAVEAYEAHIKTLISIADAPPATNPSCQSLPISTVRDSLGA